jgi:hypothetical protein
MYARLQEIDGADQTSDWAVPDQLTSTIAGHPGFAGLYFLAPTGPAGALGLLTLWHTAEDAERASERTAAQLGPRPGELASDEIYEVTNFLGGAAAQEAPVNALVLRFGGPMSQQQRDATEFATRERIIPAVTAIEGLVCGFDLWHAATRSQLTVTLATSAEALDEMSRAVMATSLLPGEDPALLPGVDSVTEYSVGGHVSPVPAAR